MNIKSWPVSVILWGIMIVLLLIHLFISIDEKSVTAHSVIIGKIHYVLIGDKIINYTSDSIAYENSIIKPISWGDINSTPTTISSPNGGCDYLGLDTTPNRIADRLDANYNKLKSTKK